MTIIVEVSMVMLRTAPIMNGTTGRISNYAKKNSPKRLIAAAGGGGRPPEDNNNKIANYEEIKKHILQFKNDFLKSVKIESNKNI